MQYLDLFKSSLKSALDRKYFLDRWISDHSLSTIIVQKYQLDFVNKGYVNKYINKAYLQEYKCYDYSMHRLKNAKNEIITKTSFYYFTKNSNVPKFFTNKNEWQQIYDNFRLLMFDFVGIETTTTAIKILAPRKKERKIVAIGASDTAGWCIDGTPSTSAFDYALGGWKYEDCGKTYEAQLATKFQASLSVQAISGIGLTQNAQAKTPWILGSRTMPQYFNLTLQEENKNLWNFTKDGIVDLVIVSLGGNDYNHQKGDRPANDVFSNAYISFLQFLFHIYDDNVMTNNKTTKILSICGMGDPYEKKRNPDNDRCSPCPHVEAAVKQFQCTVPDQISNHLFYKFIPCDGSVVHGTNDIGCNGHKNSYQFMYVR